MTSSFSSSDVQAISRTIDVELQHADNIEDAYDIEATVAEIINKKYKRVALQFPDELLNDSVPVFQQLKAGINPDQELYVLADTSYGSCCADEVTAQHVDADAIVHYGHACMSQNYRLPVIYVFGKRDLDVENCISSLGDIPLIKAPIVFRHDVAYTHQADTIVERLRAVMPNSQILYSSIPNRLYPQQEAAPAQPSIDDCTIFYVGGESLGLTNLLITHSSCDVFCYNPDTKSTRLESSQTNKLLMRRYAVVQKARDADVFGILVGTLGVASYLPLIKYLRALLSRSHKKSYTISVGKLNPSKLANFMEIECFVLVACPENSLVDAKEFLRPIVTPYELEIALQAEQSWTGRYVLDFDTLLVQARDAHAPTTHGEEEDGDQPVFSLVSGKYRHQKRYGAAVPDQDTTGQSTELVLRNQDGALLKTSENAAGQFLQNRSYQGLEMRLGKDDPSILEQGRTGIARGYVDDHKQNLKSST
ncbi:putative diphthamide synthesis protein-domain-containing protein [Mycena floridula]|nr:putative diphthamide synthesis protein-domain-containing protein [Mycena floridula]